jgi:orotidine-5'-phosphate decarboxylase
LKKKIFVALDYNSLEKALDTSKKIKDQIAGVKIGTELYAVCGLKGLQKFKEIGVKIFLDLKLHDIPNQVKKTVSAIDQLKCADYLTIHMSGNYDMIKAAKDATTTTELLGVTVLTSESNLEGIGIKNNVNDQIKLLVNLGVKAGISGVIASAQDIPLVRSISKELKIFCPGIRSGEEKQDQKRVMSYTDFFKIADEKCFAVIGRPIIEGDPVQNIKKIIQSTN